MHALRVLKQTIADGQLDWSTVNKFVRAASALILHKTSWFRPANRWQGPEQIEASDQTRGGVPAGSEAIANQRPQVGDRQSEDRVSPDPDFTFHGGGIFMKPQESMYQGIKPLLDNASCDKAILALTNILESFPDLTQAHNDLGSLYFNQGDKDKARMHFEQAARLQPENKAFQKNLADFYYGEQGRTEDALQIYRTLLRSYPEDVENLTMAGHLSVALHRYEDARGFYERVMKLEPWNWDVQQNLDQLKKRSSHGDVAQKPEDKYRRIQASLDPVNPEAGLDALRKLLQEHPEFALAHNDLGVLYYEAGNKQKALPHYERAAELQPDNMTFKKNLADFYFVEQGRVEEALKIYVEILAANPEDVETLLITGHICVSLHKFEDAKVFYERVLEIEPWNSDVRENLKRLSEIEQRNVKAKTADEMYAEIQPLLQGQNSESAVKALERLLDVYPDFALGHNDLAVLLYQSGQKDQALSHYERAVKIETDNKIFQKNLADFYVIEKARIEDALRIYVKILEHDPEDIETLMAIGKICESLQQHDDARTFYQRVLDIEPWNLEAREHLDSGPALSGSALG
jgi:tetratricopeptide (TPR) repeat protein